ncbi:MAG: hypothetical protein HY777_06420 [Betaproteobacteria bacterium]|nr:hypothetical protein [Betaproteobacteria bacterium]
MLAEQSETPQPGRPDYQHQNINLGQIGAVAAVMSVVSVTDVLTWVSQQTGVAGGFNKMLTGDPRGWCLHKDCDKYRSFVAIGASGAASWYVTSEVKDKKVVLDLVLAEAINQVLSPLPNLQLGKHEGN